MNKVGNLRTSNVLLFFFILVFLSISAFAQEEQERDRSKLITPEDQALIEELEKQIDPTKTYTKADCYFECRMQRRPVDFCWKQCSGNQFWPFHN